MKDKTDFTVQDELFLTKYEEDEGTMMPVEIVFLKNGRVVGNWKASGGRPMPTRNQMREEAMARIPDAPSGTGGN